VVVAPPLPVLPPLPPLPPVLQLLQDLAQPVRRCWSAGLPPLQPPEVLRISAAQLLKAAGGVCADTFFGGFMYTQPDAADVMTSCGIAAEAAC